jgi:lipoate-protein ligase A
VLLDGRKIAGAAQRRSRSGLLQQGSIQLRSLPPRFPREFCSTICATPHYVALTANCLSSAAELTEHKYGTAEWLTRR